MSVFPHTVAALVIAGVFGTATLATSQNAPEPDALTCALRLMQDGPTLTLTAEAKAPKAIQGTYTLEVHHSGAGGRSTIRQGGAFDLQPGERAILGEARFTARSRDLKAELTLVAGTQRRSCSDFDI